MLSAHIGREAGTPGGQRAGLVPASPITSDLDVVGSVGDGIALLVVSVLATGVR